MGGGHDDRKQLRDAVNSSTYAGNRVFEAEAATAKDPLQSTAGGHCAVCRFVLLTSSMHLFTAPYSPTHLPARPAVCALPLTPSCAWQSPPMRCCAGTCPTARAGPSALTT